MAELILIVEIDETLAQEYFDYAGAKIRDAREPFREVMHEVIFPAMREQMDSEGERSGDPWQELSEKYRLWKESSPWGGAPILELTGKMERALFDSHSYRATKDHLTYAPKSDYAHWHQGGGYVEGRPPQRKILELIFEDELHIEGIFENWLDELRTANPRRGSADLNYSPTIPLFDILG